MGHPGRAAASSAHHPWRRFSELSDWALRWAELPPGVMGLTSHATRTVTLALGMSQAERRCTIAHETEHILRGPVPPHETGPEELSIDRTVARLLMPSLARVADAIVRASGHLETAADDLWVDDYLLQFRLGSLTATELSYVQRRLAEVLC